MIFEFLHVADHSVFGVAEDYQHRAQVTKSAGLDGMEGPSSCAIDYKEMLPVSDRNTCETCIIADGRIRMSMAKKSGAVVPLVWIAEMAILRWWAVLRVW